MPSSPTLSGASTAPADPATNSSDADFTKTTKTDESRQEEEQESTGASSERAAAEDMARAKARTALRWGYTPKEEYNPERDPAKMPADHPVHQVSPAKIEKWQRKGINPVLRAEMDNRGNKEGRFWSKVAETSMGGSWIR